MGQRNELIHRLSRIFHISQPAHEQKQQLTSVLQKQEDIDVTPDNVNNAQKSKKSRWSTSHLKIKLLQHHPSLIFSSSKGQQQERMQSYCQNGIDNLSYHSNKTKHSRTDNNRSNYLYTEKVEIDEDDSFTDTLEINMNSNSPYCQQQKYIYAGSTNQTSTSIYSTFSTSTTATTTEEDTKRFSSSTAAIATSTAVAPICTPPKSPELKQHPPQLMKSECPRQRSRLLILTPPSSPTASLSDIIVDDDENDHNKQTNNITIDTTVAVKQEPITITITRTEIAIHLSFLVREILGDAFETADKNLLFEEPL
ncbi:hypothetical protein BDF20DRAFT_912218 [Mycotypha africana]|uniref:uncharacterized protein n=1 Tax=Mycotypha africana TaxID=64632 RepID=UPI0023009602|nr:uncharacterized protein BDF20DRAFT_912218 [Mycotypha africana]KAI8982013.1 hypothetical protein BDF20DRAFT_912218 [Mycotypha africana]